jgi:hypothetical protein
MWNTQVNMMLDNGGETWITMKPFAKYPEHIRGTLSVEEMQKTANHGTAC